MKTELQTKPKSKLNYKIFLLVGLSYALIFAQYPLGVAVSRLALHANLESIIQPSALLLWAVVRLLIVLPLLFSMLAYFDRQKEILLQLGDKRRMFSFAFWGTFAFAVLGVLLYPVFLNQTRLTAFNLLYLLPIFSLYAISNSFSEELFFRGISLTALKDKMPFWVANIIQAFFFALIHFTTPARLSNRVLIFVFLTFLLGLFWGWTARKTQSLLPSIVMHLIADVFVAISLF